MLGVKIVRSKTAEDPAHYGWAMHFLYLFAAVGEELQHLEYNLLCYIIRVYRALEVRGARSGSGHRC